MMNERYLTVAEYAALRNISESAVYSQIRNGKLKTTEKQSDTGRYIKLIVVSEETTQTNEAIPEESESISQENEVNSSNASQSFEVLTQQFELLQTTISTLQKQLEVKDNQIAELQKMLANSQQLQAQSNTLLLQAKEEPTPEPEAAIVPAEPPKRSFFARLFNK